MFNRWGLHLVARDAEAFASEGDNRRTVKCADFDFKNTSRRPVLAEVVLSEKNSD